MDKRQEVREATFDILTDNFDTCRSGCEFYDKQGHFCFIRDVGGNIEKCAWLKKLQATESSLGVVLKAEGELPETFVPTPDDLKELEIDGPEAFRVFGSLSEEWLGALRAVEILAMKRMKEAGWAKTCPLEEEK